MSGERALPAQASLRYLKVEAKRRHAAGEFTTLHLAQVAIAREHGAAPAWQVAVSAAVSVACTAGVARAAIAAYRTSILRTGRRVPLRELLIR